MGFQWLNALQWGVEVAPFSVSLPALWYTWHHSCDRWLIFQHFSAFMTYCLVNKVHVKLWGHVGWGWLRDGLRDGLQSNKSLSCVPNQIVARETSITYSIMHAWVIFARAAKISLSAIITFTFTFLCFIPAGMFQAVRTWTIPTSRLALPCWWGVLNQDQPTYQGMLCLTQTIYTAASYTPWPSHHPAQLSHGCLLSDTLVWGKQLAQLESINKLL